MRRSVLVKASTGLSRTAKRSVRTLAETYHFHACKECRLLYQDACAKPESNAICDDCRGLARSFWEKARDPQPCCVNNTEMVVGDDVVTYRLAGPGPWFKCNTCARCHGWAVRE